MSQRRDSRFPVRVVISQEVSQRKVRPGNEDLTGKRGSIGADVSRRDWWPGGFSGRCGSGEGNMVVLYTGLGVPQATAGVAELSYRLAE